MIDSSFYFKNRLAKTFGIELQCPITVSEPVPRVTRISAPGRNGDYVLFDGCYENRTITAKCYILDYAMPGKVAKINEWLVGEAGSFEFRDTDDKLHFMLARCTAGLPLNTRAHVLGDFELTFDADPRRFLLSGQKPILLDSGYIQNPRPYTAYPIVTFTVKGLPATLVYIVGDANIHIDIPDRSELAGITEISYDAERDYTYATGDDGKVKDMSEYCFADNTVSLKPGGTFFSPSAIGGNNKVNIKSVIPRWWEL